MPGLLAGFAQKYPGITVALREGDQEEMISAMLAGRIELALAYSLAVPDEIEAEPLIDLPPFAIVAADHPLARRKSVRLCANSRTSPSSCSICRIRATIFSGCSALPASSRASCSSRARRN